jgi:hypothetical protein|tara:strand:- start:2929 stop:3582 length:654 start_codon:yes stop_codon:yes gene_type:complete
MFNLVGLTPHLQPQEINMSGSDVQVAFITDENAADPDRLVTAARPNTSATMAATTFVGGGARNVTVTTAGTSDNAKTNTIVGTDVFGDALSEVIVSTGSAEAVAGEKLFLTVTSVTSSAQFAGNITVGSGSLCSKSAGGGARVRLVGTSIVSAGTAGLVDFYNGTPDTGTIIFKAQTIGTDHATVDNTIPDEGLLFKDGLSVVYTVATVSLMNIFHS